MKSPQDLHLSRIQEEGLFGYRQLLIREGETVESVRNVTHNGVVVVRKGVCSKVKKLVIQGGDACQSPHKKIMLEGYGEQEFNPKRFKPV